MHRTKLALLVVGSTLIFATTSSAQDSLLEQMYGSGVHAYFSGDSKGAFEQLSALIDLGSKDPRSFYFRGLAYIELGREHEAKRDFATGAKLEAEDTNKFYGVGSALARVQGKKRLLLEKYRAQARLVAMKRRERMHRTRYEELAREESRVLLPQTEGPRYMEKPALEKKIEDANAVGQHRNLATVSDPTDEENIVATEAQKVTNESLDTMAEETAAESNQDQTEAVAKPAPNTPAERSDLPAKATSGKSVEPDSDEFDDNPFIDERSTKKQNTKEAKNIAVEEKASQKSEALDSDDPFSE